MRLPQLESITITDFRSIKGTVTLPLGAPVVLIHGPNGSGKTSVMAAIEVALTGDVASFRRIDPGYFKHLPHRGSQEARIALRIKPTPAMKHEPAVNMAITATGPLSAPLFGPRTAQFFAERCYLAQATLGRLLEIYQEPSITATESYLTRFVKDVLGLDQLDSVIDGLYTSEDIRRVRNLLPAYRETEELQRRSASQVVEGTARIKQLDEEVRVTRERLEVALRQLPDGTAFLPVVVPAESLAGFLRATNEERQLVALAGTRRTLASLRAEWSELSHRPEAANGLALEDELRRTTAALKEWRVAVGGPLETLIEGLRTTFPDLPSSASTDPETSRRAAADRVARELQRCERLLAEDETIGSQLKALAETLSGSRARVAAIDRQLADAAVDTTTLSQALAAIIPHIDGEVCPVCARDYSELEKEPLVARVSARVAELTSQSEHIHALTKARADATGAITTSQREQQTLLQGRLDDGSRGELRSRATELAQVAAGLDRHAEHSAGGAMLLRTEAEARKRLAEFRDRDRRATEVRTMLAEMARNVAQIRLDETDGVSEVLDRLEALVKKQEAELVNALSRRAGALKDYELIQALTQSSIATKRDVDQEQRTLQRAREGLARAAAVRREAKEFSAAAKRVRSAIVRRVFNTSLNAMWRDLFVRLAPMEAYVPAFRVPEDANGPLIATLETVHRSGERGGSPAAMLSSGNLNTAALTLFLALHFSVALELPWLILDDPVQSMDEVHVAQFAALLRAVSKHHDRQVLIAVHDRAMFDYLTLELSPAFPEDQLVTVELGRSDSGATLANPIFHSWKPERVFAVG